MKLLIKDPRQRLSMAACLKHDWFKLKKADLTPLVFDDANDFLQLQSLSSKPQSQNVNQTEQLQNQKQSLMNSRYSHRQQKNIEIEVDCEEQDEILPSLPSMKQISHACTQDIEVCEQKYYHPQRSGKSGAMRSQKTQRSIRRKSTFFYNGSNKEQ